MTTDQMFTAMYWAIAIYAIVLVIAVIVAIVWGHREPVLNSHKTLSKDSPKDQA
jgi:hypothetical protein